MLVSSLVLMVGSLRSITSNDRRFMEGYLRGVARRLGEGVLTRSFRTVAFLTISTNSVSRHRVRASITCVVDLLAVSRAMNVTVTRATIRTVDVSSEGNDSSAILVRSNLTAMTRAVTHLRIIRLRGNDLRNTRTISNLIITKISTVRSRARATRVRLTLQRVLSAYQVTSVTRSLVIRNDLRLSTSLVRRFGLVNERFVRAVIVTSRRIERSEAESSNVLVLRLASGLLRVIF